METIKVKEDSRMGAPIPDWRRELSQMMGVWHLSIKQIEDFCIKTIESEIAKNKRL